MVVDFMPRAPRLDYPDARRPVMNRGARREPVFRADNDCLAFLDLLARASALFGLRVYAYALMGNHHHLLQSTAQKSRASLGDLVAE